MAKKGTETVVVRAAPTRNPDGDPEPGAEVFTATDAIIWPRTSTEAANRGEIILDGLTIFLPAPVGGDVLATYEIEARGKAWKVEGAAGDYRKANGRQVGFIINVQRSGV